MKKELSLLEKAKNYAIECHRVTNHMYGDQPYEFHLNMVYEYGVKYSYLLPTSLVEIVLASCYTHDTIEDARQTYNDVKKVCGTKVAEITRAVTSDCRERTREERMSKEVYEDIRTVAGATFIKLCDRLANVSNGVRRSSRILETYKKEYPHFKDELYDVRYDDMFKELEMLLGL
jgi:(p)ppGpp synthase/HD superfamily hydrolase